MLWLLLACSDHAAILNGEALASGNPVPFIAQCNKQDSTALALQAAVIKSGAVSAGADCEAVWPRLSTVTNLDLSHVNAELDLKAISGMTNLKELSAYEKGIRDLEPIRNLIRMEKLYLVRNKITDISPLENLTQLRYLRLDGNDITNIRVVSKLRKLEKLGLDDNNIFDFRPIAELPVLMDLNTNFNPVDLEKCPDGPTVTPKLVKYCKRLKKKTTDIQGAIDPKDPPPLRK